MGKISAPELLTINHQLNNFNSNESSLNDWLIKRALKNQSNGASRTFVTHQDMQVIGYYCLAAGSVICAEAPSKIKRNMPDPIPVMVLGRLAVDRTMLGQGIGKGLLKDALLRTLKVAKDVGFRALLVHALSNPARQFYKRFGFIESPIDDMTLFLSFINFKDLMS